MLAAALACTPSARAQAQPTGTLPTVRVATLGDSLTDEYTELPFSASRSWTQLLALRGGNFGPHCADIGEGRWFGTRGIGFQDNWALAGSTTDTAIQQEQHTKAAAGAQARGVRIAVVWLGNNDFAHWQWQNANTTSLFGRVYSGIDAPQEVENYLASRLNNLSIIIDTLSARGIKVIVAGPIDFSVCAHTSSIFNDPTRLEFVDERVTLPFNRSLRSLCASKNAIFVDTRALFRAMFRPDGVWRQQLFISGTPIQAQIREDSPTATDAKRAWVFDGVHPTTTIQAIVSNVMATAINKAVADLGLSAPPLPMLSDLEILALVGLPPTRGMGVQMQIGTWESFVNPPIPGCRVDLDNDGLVGVPDVFEFLRRYMNTDPRADWNQSGTVDLADIFAFLSAWFTGCAN